MSAIIHEHELLNRLITLRQIHVAVTDSERRTQSHCRVALTIEEKLEYGQLNADSQRAIKQFEDELATIKKQLQARIDGQEAVIDQLSEALRSGYETRQVECIVVLEYPKRGRKTTFRLDTLEAVEEGLMTESELQRMLKLEEVAKAQAEKEGELIEALAPVSEALPAAEAPEQPEPEPKPTKLPKMRKPDATI